MVALEFLPDDFLHPGGNGTFVQKGFQFFYGLLIALGIDFYISIPEIFNGPGDPQLISGPLGIIPEGHALDISLHNVMIGLHCNPPIDLAAGSKSLIFYNCIPVQRRSGSDR